MKISRRIRNVEPWMIAVPAIAVAGATAFVVTRLVTRRMIPAGTPEPATVSGVPFASGGPRPTWPVLTNHEKAGLVSYQDVDGRFHGNWGRRFGAPRNDRNHAGIDLYAFAGDTVVAMLDGVVTNTQSFHLGSSAIFVDHGPFVVMYGEVETGSWNRFGVAPGTKVSKGQPIARADCMSGTIGNCSSHMLHLEAYAPGTSKNARWYRNAAVPQSLLDPTRLLLRASG
jgi:murein DD-endopeptidase MepM/ murein hydrolase activator NlpD